MEENRDVQLQRLQDSTSPLVVALDEFLATEDNVAAEERSQIWSDANSLYSNLKGFLGNLQIQKNFGSGTKVVMKVYIQDTPHLSMSRVKSSFFKYAPAWVSQVDDFRQADVFFYWSHSRHFTPLPNGLDASNAWHQDNAEETADYYQSLSGKPRIFWLDAFSKNGHFNEYPDFLSEKDVVTSTCMSPHLNAVVSQVIDPEEFYCFASERLPKSVMVMGGHTFGSLSFQDDIVTELNALLSEGSIETLIGLESPDEYYPKFREHSLKVFASSFAPHEMYKGLNLVDYTLQTQVGVGMELLGFEGGFCGAQPIYPDTPYYRDHFGDDLGIAYIDTDSPLESLIDIFARPLVWREKYMAKFVNAFSAKVHIPKFWEAARRIMGFSMEV